MAEIQPKIQNAGQNLAKNSAKNPAQPLAQAPAQTSAQDTKTPFIQNIRKLAERSFMISNIIKSAVFFLITILITFGTFFLENKLASSKEITDVQPLTSFDYTKENIIPDNGIVRFAADFQNSIDILPFQTSPNYLFKFNSGKVWGNFSINNSKINILVGDKIVLIPKRAVFDMEFDGKKLTINNFDGNIYIGFLDDGITLSEYQNEYSPLFVNRLLLPRGNQVAIPLSKIDERTKQLLYSKLIKEFKYSAIPSTLKETDWVKQNALQDSKYIESIKQQAISDILSRGVSVEKSKFGDFVFWSEENLTFVPSKKEKMIYSHLFSFLNDAIYYSTLNDLVAAQGNLDEFNYYFLSIPEILRQGQEYLSKYDRYIDVLSIFGPDDPQYQVLNFLLDKKFTDGRDKYEIVNKFWLDIYTGLNTSDVLAEESINRYYQYLDLTLGDNSDPEFYKTYITYQNQLFDNLLLKFSLFYKDVGYFDIKNVLENELLSLYSEGQLKNELKQDLVSNKIDFLKRLRRFFFDNELSVEQSKQIFSKVIEEVYTLLPDETSNVAVTELFKSELNDVGDFWKYLNSPEYHSSKIYGSTNEERYNSFLKEKDRIYSLIDVQKDILGAAKGVELTVDDVKKEVEAIFNSIPEISNIEIGEIATTDQRYVKIKAVISGYPFEAVYDRDKISLKEIYAFGELLSDNAIKIDSLLNLLKSKFANLQETPDEEIEALSPETYAERYAKTFIADKVSEYGFEAKLEDVEIADELNAIYRLNNIEFKDKPEVKITFDFMMTNEKAKNVLLTISGKPILFNDQEYTLEELQNIALAEGDFNPDKSNSIKR